MNLRKIGNNETEIDVANYQILFSYNTPVACVDTRTGNGYKTEKFWSKTTSRHINKWLALPELSAKKPQEFFDNLIKDRGVI